MLNKELPYGQELHKRVLAAIIQRKDLSEDRFSDYHEKWKKNDEAYKGYLHESEITKATKKKRETEGKLNFYTIEIPYSYAVASTAHTFWCTTFLSRTPIFQYSARHGEPQTAVQGVEAIIDYQMRVGEMLVPLYTFLNDLAKYGLAFMWNYWDEEIIQTSRIVEEPVKIAGITVPNKVKKLRYTEKAYGYRGNRIFPVRLYDALPDPRVSMAELQKGEFFGRRIDSSWNDLIRAKETGDYYNLDKVKHLAGTRRDREESRAESLPDNDEVYTALELGVDNISLIEMVVDLIPAEWGLGTSEYPEKWMFTVAEEEIIIGSKPLGLRHGKFPVVAAEFDPGNQELVKNGLIDITKPMADTITWLLNTHFWSVRKSLNDVRIFDPSKLVVADVLDPQPGNLIRLRPEAYGTDVRTAMHQFPVQDVTQGHLRDTQVMEQFIQRITGVVDNLMGIVNPSGRKTATEVRTASGFSMNRLKTVAEYNSAMAFNPLSQMLLQNTQQLFDDEMKFRLLGNLAEDAEAFMSVGPDQIAGFYDFVPVDGSLPVDRIAQANFWREFISTIAASPEISSQFDMTNMVMHTMKLLGEKNVDHFKAKVVPDRQITQGVQDGNLVPVR